MIEKTLALIKPDAFRNKSTGDIIAIIEKEGFVLHRLEKRKLTRAEAEAFYAVHKDKPFFGEVIDFMTSGPLVAMVLEKEDAVASWRRVMGATNPEEAALGTVRKRFGKDIGMNAVHGSDSLENAALEIALMFPE